MNQDNAGWSGPPSDTQRPGMPHGDSPGTSPWSVPGDAFGGRQPRSTGSNRGLWLIVGSILFLMLLMCGGLVTLGIFGLREIAKSDSPITLPATEETFHRDRAALSELMQDTQWPAHPQQQQLETWLKTRMDQAQAGNVSVNPSLFYEAVVKSSRGQAISAVARLQLKETLKLGMPQPSSAQHFNLLGVRQGPTPETAELYILLYSDDTLAELTIWFVGEDQGEWHLYDWSETDLGRRASDEYANYFLHTFSPHVDGYDNVIRFIGQADAKYAEGEEERAAALLTLAAQTNTLPADRDRAFLQVGWAYQRQADWEKSKRLFEKIRDKDEVAGAWASLGVSQIELNEYDAAIASAARLRQLFGNHPAADFITAQALNLKDDEEAATDHYLRYLQLCPNDATAFYAVVAIVAEHQLADMLDVVLASDNADDWFVSVLQWQSTPEVRTVIQDALAERDETPAGWADYLVAIETRQQEENSAASLFHQIAVDAGHGESIRENARREWLQLRLSGIEPEKLVEEATQPDALVQEILEAVLDDEWFADSEAVLTLLNHLQPGQREQRMALALAGWAEYDQENWLTAWQAFEKVFAAREEKAGSEHNWVIDSLERIAFDSLMELERYADALAHFGDQPGYAIELGKRMALPGHQEAQNRVLKQLESRDDTNARILEAFLYASQAAREGDVEACDAHWQECLEAAAALSDTPDAYHIDQLASDYGRQLVRLRRLPTLLQQTSLPFWESLVDGAGNELMNLHDRSLAQELNRQIEATDNRSAKESVTRMLATLAYADHQWAVAARYYEQHDRLASEDEWNYYIYRSRKKRFDAYLRDNEIEQAREFLRESEPADRALMRAKLQCATGQFSEVAAELTEESPASVGYWLFDSSLHHWLLQNPAEVSDVINDWNVRLSTIQTEWSAILLQSQPVTLDAERLRERLRPVVDGELEIVLLRSDRSPELQQRWLVRRGDDLIVVVSAGDTKWHHYRLTSDQRQEFRDQQNASMSVEVIYSARPLTKVGIELVAALADDATLAVGDRERNYLWLRNDQPWNQRFAWKGRVPFDADTITDAYLSAAWDDSEEDSEAMGMSASDRQEVEPVEQTRLQELAESRSADSRDGQTLRARVRLTTGIAAEWLPVEVLAYDETEDLATVRLQQKSLLFPPLQETNQLRVPAWEVMQTASAEVNE